MARRIDQLIEEVKNRGSIPSNEKRFQNPGITQFINQELRDFVFPFLVRKNSEFFLSTALYPIAPSFIGNIPIPKRAYARAIRNINYQDANGTYYDIPYINLPDANAYPLPASQPQSINGPYPYGFYFYNDSIQFVGSYNAPTGTVNIIYVVQPSTLISPAATGGANEYVGKPITAVGTNGGGLVTLTSAVMPQVPATGLVDIVRVSTGVLLYPDVVMAYSGGAYVDVNGVLTQSMFDGLQSPYQQELYVMPAGQSAYSLIPAEADDLLVARVVSRIYEALGYVDTGDYGVIQKEIEIMQKNLADMYAERSKGQLKKVVSRRGIGRISMGGSRWPWSGWWR